jgi:hypothetical protein
VGISDDCNVERSTIRAQERRDGGEREMGIKGILKEGGCEDGRDYTPEKLTSGRRPLEGGDKHSG